MKSRYIGELADQRIDLAQAQRQLRMPLQIAAHEAVLAGAHFQSGGAGIVDAGGAVLLGQRQHALNAAHRGLAVLAGACRGRARRSAAPALSARHSSCCVPSGVCLGRSSSWMRWRPRAWRRCSRSNWPVLRVQQPDMPDDPTAPGRAGRSSPAARRSRRLRLPRSRPDAPCVRRIGNSGTARPAAAARRASLRRTWPRPAAWWCRGCACRPSALPSDPGRPAPPPGFRSACPSAVSSAHGRRRSRPSLCDPGSRTRQGSATAP